MDLEQLFAHWGYLALLFGSFLDGTPVMLFGGFAAHRGWLALVPWVIVAGAAGNFLAGAAWFAAARLAGDRLLAWRPGWAAEVDRVRPRLARWEAPVVVGSRFLPGLSLGGLLAAGLSGIAPGRFLALNALAALLWAAAYGTLGFLLGHSVELLLAEVERFERPVALGLLAAGAAWIALVQARRWRRAPAGPPGRGS